MRKVLRPALVLIMLAGLALAGHGLYMQAKAALSQVLLARAFDERLAGNAEARPWPWADFTLAGRIEAPRIQRANIVLAGVTGEALAFGPGLMPNLPVPGQQGTAVIAAHRDSHFAWLKQVIAGDTIRIINPDGRRLDFVVTGTRIAKWNDSGINPHAYGRHLALVTCFPFDARTHGDLRYIVETVLKQDLPATVAGM